MSWSHLMKAHDASLSANHDKTNNDKNEDLYPDQNELKVLRYEADLRTRAERERNRFNDRLAARIGEY